MCQALDTNIPRQCIVLEEKTCCSLHVHYKEFSRLKMADILLGNVCKELWVKEALIQRTPPKKRNKRQQQERTLPQKRNQGTSVHAAWDQTISQKCKIGI